MRCEGGVARSGLYGVGSRPLVARHVASCLRCQVERARRERLRRLLAQLQLEQAALAPGVLASMLDAIQAAAAQEADEPGTGLGRAWRATAAAGALAGAVLLLALRSRLGRQGSSPSRCYR